MNRRLTRAARALKRNGLLHYTPTPGQRRAHEMQARLRALIAANRVGKTKWGGAESWYQATGRHPYRVVRRKKGVMWICVGTWGKPYQAVAKHLYELAPKDLIDWKKTEYQSHGHWRNHRITLRDGYEIGFVSSKGSSVSAASDGADALWIDEPPKKHQMGELLARTSDVNGPVWLTCTPVDSEQDLTWLQHYLEGNPEEGTGPQGDWHLTRITYSPENVPWKTAEEIEEQVALYGPWEYAQRVLGEWHGAVVGRWLPHFVEDCIFTDADLEAMGGLPPIVELALAMDHGEGAGKQVCYLLAWDGHRLWVLGEYVNKEHTDPDTDAAGIERILTAWGVDWFAIDRAWGDTNSLGKAGAGITVNAALELAIARRLKLPAPPFRIEPAAKGAGSVKRGTKVIDLAFLSGRLRVHASCRKLIRAGQMWRGADDEHKHAIDGVRYGAVEYLGPIGPAASKVVLA